MTNIGEKRNLIREIPYGPSKKKPRAFVGPGQYVNENVQTLRSANAIIVCRPLVVGKDLAARASCQQTDTGSTPAAQQSAHQSACSGPEHCVKQTAVSLIDVRLLVGCRIPGAGIAVSIICTSGDRSANRSMTRCSTCAISCLSIDSSSSRKWDRQRQNRGHYC